MEKQKINNNLIRNSKVYLACDRRLNAIWAFSKEPEWGEYTGEFYPSRDEKREDWYYLDERECILLLGRVLDEGELVEVDITTKVTKIDNVKIR